MVTAKMLTEKVKTKDIVKELKESFIILDV